MPVRRPVRRGELDLSRQRRDSFGDPRAGSLPMRRVLQWQSQSPVGEVLQRQNAGVKCERCRETLRKRVFVFAFCL